jgi:hypothetical protein
MSAQPHRKVDHYIPSQLNTKNFNFIKKKHTLELYSVKVDDKPTNTVETTFELKTCKKLAD